MANQFKFEVSVTSDNVATLLSVEGAHSYLVTGCYYFNSDWKMYTSAQGIDPNGQLVGPEIKPCPTPCPTEESDPPRSKFFNELRFQVKIQRSQMQSVSRANSKEYFVAIEYTYNGAWSMEATLFGYDESKIIVSEIICPTPCP